MEIEDNDWQIVREIHHWIRRLQPISGSKPKELTQSTHIQVAPVETIQRSSNPAWLPLQPVAIPQISSIIYNSTVIVEQNDANLDNIERIDKFIESANVTSDKLEALDKTLERQSRIQQKLQRSLTPNLYETWVSRWISYLLVISILPKDRYEEWLGDLYENNQKMMANNYPRWYINATNFVLSLVLIFSATRIKLSDLFIAFKAKRE